MLERVITGGQTGADQAGWRAARACGIPTGGWMPMGFRTEGAVDPETGETGPDMTRPEFAELYGAVALESLEYRVRTRENVRRADAVAWFGGTGSRGGRLTLGMARILDRPVFVVLTGEDGRPDAPPTRLADWLRSGSFRVLNIAGNRESITPGIGAWVEAYLIATFRALGPGGD